MFDGLLAPQVFPTAIATLPLPQLWGCLFFIMLLFLGISSAISMTTPLTMALQQHVARSRKQRHGACGWWGMCAHVLTATPTRIAVGVHLLGFLCGLLYTTCVPIQRRTSHRVSMIAKKDPSHD